MNVERDVSVRRVHATDPARAGALEDGTRARILNMVADEAMPVAAIVRELRRGGREKAETTVRHHVNVLREAGLVEVVRLEGASGGTRKYYRSTARIYSYELPEDADDTLAPAIDGVTDVMDTLIATILAEYGEEIDSVAREMEPCEYCSRQRYREFVVREILERSLGRLSKDEAFGDTG
jgi:DNA-binding transcriptional ArsR family regulator